MNGLSIPQVIVAVVAIMACFVLLLPALFWLWIAMGGNKASTKPKRERWTIRPIFAWFDFWVGAYWDATKRKLFIFPVPMFGVVVQFAAKPAPAPEPNVSLFPTQMDHPGEPMFYMSSQNSSSLKWWVGHSAPGAMPPLTDEISEARRFTSSEVAEFISPYSIPVVSFPEHVVYRAATRSMKVYVIDLEREMGKESR